MMIYAFLELRSEGLMKTQKYPSFWPVAYYLRP